MNTDTNTDTQAKAATLPTDANGNSIGQDSKAWPQTFDGLAWAIEFNKRFPTVPVDDALGWMANSLMRGFDEAHSRLAPALHAKRTHASIVSGALFDLLGFLTTQSPPITLGATVNATQGAELLERFALSREFSLADADVMGWQEHINLTGKHDHVAVVTFDEKGGAHFHFNQPFEVNSTTKLLAKFAPPEVSEAAEGVTL